MLTRLYIDNFRCFVKFEYRPARTQLILGANGSGKSTLIDALLFLHRFAVEGQDIAGLPLLEQRTRWLDQSEQTFELEATLDGGNYSYRVVFESWIREQGVRSESVHLDGKPIFEFLNGEVRLYDDSFALKLTYPIGRFRSAFATVAEGDDLRKLTRFRQWLRGIVCFRMNPFAMETLSKTADPNPSFDLSNIASWYRYVMERRSGETDALIASLREALDGFTSLQVLGAGATRILGLQFVDSGRDIVFSFGELSEGQRCLFGLYSILHFVLAKGNTVILDEPDNFISLREIQPWLMAVEDAVEDSGGQILIISHHPELINQWATSGGVQFIRDGIGPVRVEDFHFEPASGLAPAELVARGWEHA